MIIVSYTLSTSIIKDQSILWHTIYLQIYQWFQPQQNVLILETFIDESKCFQFSSILLMTLQYSKGVIEKRYPDLIGSCAIVQ